MNANGSNLVNLTNNPAYDMYPAWSPDGTKIIFGTARGTRPGGGLFKQNEIYSMKPDGTDLVNLTDDLSAVEGFATWTADGRIAYSKTIQLDLTQYVNELWVMNADGSGQMKIAADVGFVAWRPAH